MKKNFYTSVLLLVVLMFTGYTIYYSLIVQEDSDNIKNVGLNDLFDNKIIQYMEAIEYPLSTSYNFFYPQDSSVNFASLSSHPRIGLYIDAHQCTSCWQKELTQLSHWNDSLHFENIPIIIANNFNIREIKIMQDKTEFPIYSIGADINFLPTLTKFNIPFFFVIESNTISRPYFPSENLSIDFSSKYLNHIIAILHSKENNNNKNNENFLTFYNPIVNLGRVGIRKKEPIIYKIHNNSNKPCMVYRCSPSCSCVLVDSFSTAIPAGEDGFIAISSVQINKGEFHHSINIQTNFQSQPYSTTFTGYCE